MPHISGNDVRTADGGGGLVVVGSTGRLGSRVVELASARGIRLAGLAVGSDTALAVGQVAAHVPRLVWTRTGDVRDHVARRVDLRQTRIVSGPEHLCDLADLEAQTLVVCIPSLDALELTSRWLASGRPAVVASKELLVAAAWWLRERAETGMLVPLDSELTAAAHLLRRCDGRIRKLVLPASGGPFWGMDASCLRDVTPAQALDHPVWHMGPKVTVDSATMVNKAFELLAAKSMFGLDVGQLDAVIHREGIVHAMVQDETGAWLWQAGPTTMDWAIEYALFGRSDSVFAELGGIQWSFGQVTAPFDRALRLARIAMEGSVLCPAMLVGADDVAVEAFLAGQLPFSGIWDLLERVITQPDGIEMQDDDVMADIRQAVAQGRRDAKALLPR